MSKKKPSPVKNLKKQTREMVYEKLAVALAEYKNAMKEKKFVSNLRKASKLFAEDIYKKSTKPAGRDKKNKGKKEVPPVITG